MKKVWLRDFNILKVLALRHALWLEWSSSWVHSYHSFLIHVDSVTLSLTVHTIKELKAHKMKKMPSFSNFTKIGVSAYCFSKKNVTKMSLLIFEERTSGIVIFSLQGHCQGFSLVSTQNRFSIILFTAPFFRELNLQEVSFWCLLFFCPEASSSAL